MNAHVFVPPAWPDSSLNLTYQDCVFLAGTIEMGNSPDWQSDVIQELKDYNIVIFNPRRVLPPESEDDIVKQINWELDGIHTSKTVYMHLCANTISPISLLELGLLQGRADSTKVIVYCDPAYLRRLNVLTTTSHKFWENFEISVYSDYQESIKALKRRIEIVTSLQDW